MINQEGVHGAGHVPGADRLGGLAASPSLALVAHADHTHQGNPSLTQSHPKERDQSHQGAPDLALAHDHRQSARLFFVVY